jgi:phage protein D/phage baseplate assembly protein gpV
MPEKFSLKISGISDPFLFGDIVEIVVDTNVYLPGMFTILIEDKQAMPGLPALMHTDNMLRFRIGASVAIGAESEGIINNENTLIKGEITAIEPVFDQDGRILLRIRGYDRSHRLTMGRSTRTFGDANPRVATITEAQIVKDIASSAGLIPKIDMSGLSNARYHYVMQYNQNNWDFLWARAQLLGYQVYVDDRMLHFEKAGKERHSDNPETLIWGENLSRFEPRLVSADQVTEVTTTGWDPDKKQSIKSSSSSHSSNTVAKTAEVLKGSKAIKLAFRSGAEDFVIDTAARSAGLAKNMAEARFAEHESDYVRASGELPSGDPCLLAGTVVTIANVGVRFSGKYYVTAAKHIYRNGRYMVKFEVSGRNPYTFRHLLLGQDHTINKVDGVVVGVVTNINDPEKLGRVQVKYPWLPKYKGSDLSSNWARQATLGAGTNRGVFFTPEIDDEVLVAFENGDINYPYIVGALWNGRDKPPEGKVVAVNKVNQRIVRSRSGHVIILDDTQGQEKITIQDKTGKNSIEIDSKMNSMMIKSAGDLTLDAGGKLIIKSKADFNINSMGKAGISATSNLDLEGKVGASLKAGMSSLDLQAAGAALKGTKVDVQATAQASVKGSAMVEIQGALVKIN